MVVERGAGGGEGGRGDGESVPVLSPGVWGLPAIFDILAWGQHHSDF